MLLWVLAILTTFQDANPFLEDRIRGYYNHYEYFLDDQNRSLEEVINDPSLFLHKDSLSGIGNFERYWFKVYAPGLEDSVDYFLKYYAYFDELEVYMNDGIRFHKKWNRVSDTTRISVGRTHFVLRKSDLIDGSYFYMKGYIANYRVNTFRFQTLNGKAIWTINNKAMVDSIISYHSYNFAFAGAIVIILLYVLATYVYNRDSVYLIYSIYLISIGLYLFSRSYFVSESIYPHLIPIFPDLDYYLSYPVQFIVHLSYLWFTISFLNAKKNYPLFYESGKWVSVFFIACIIVSVISIEFIPETKFWLQLYFVERYIAIAYTIGLQIYMIINRKNVAATFIIVGSIFFILGASLSMIASDVFYFRTGALLEVVTFSLGLAYRLRNAENSKALLEKEVERVKMIALRTQMKPHFLFNTINSIRALILNGDKDEAYENLATFSKLIRYILESSESDLVSLKDELRMLSIYVEMEKLRLADGFNFEYQVAEQVDPDRSLIPPLILQPFIENSIIHGLSSKEGDKEVRLSINKDNNKLLCSIEDNGVGRQNINKPNPDKKSMAIDLTKRRISLLSQSEIVDESIKIIDLEDSEGNATGTKVDVKLPIILSA